MPEPGDRGNSPDVLAVVPGDIDVGETAHRTWHPELGLRYRRAGAREHTPLMPPFRCQLRDEGRARPSPRPKRNRPLHNRSSTAACVGDAQRVMPGDNDRGGAQVDIGQAAVRYDISWRLSGTNAGRKHLHLQCL
jgi:hypothetical protein